LSKAWLSGRVFTKALTAMPATNFRAPSFGELTEHSRAAIVKFAATQTQTRICGKPYFAGFFVSVRHLVERERLLSSRPNSDSPFKRNVRFAP